MEIAKEDVKKNPDKILLIHNFAQVRGGADRYFVALQSLLKSQGHEVLSFTAEQDVDLLEFRLSESFRYLYNHKAARKLASLLEKFKPDIAHCQNIYGHLTPSILPVLKRHKIPVVMTLHDWKLICPNHRLFTQGRICERCKGGHYYQALAHRCFKNSWKFSFLGMVESYLHDGFNFYKNYIDCFISPSHFLKEKFLEFGWTHPPMEVIGNFVSLKGCQNAPALKDPQGLVYAGAFSEVKGVLLLLEAMALVKTPTRLLLFGDGPVLEMCKSLACKSPHHDIQFFPFAPHAELHQAMQSSLFTVLPSLWYENQPFSILESYALGRAVVGSDRGGIAELIQDGRTGFLFKAGDPKSLAEKITTLLQNPAMALDLGQRGYDKVKEKFNPDVHYQEILKVYEELLKGERE